MRFKVLTVIGLFFLLIHCEKESPTVSIESVGKNGYVLSGL